MKSAVIIGGGLGGLFTGAILAKEGIHVTVLEKNATIGGGLQTFRRFGEDFDTGMHVIGGMHPGDNVYRICEYLGINDRIDIRPVDDDCTDELHFAEDNATYKLRRGRTGFVKSLASYFPEEEENIRNYTDAVFRIADSIDLFNLRPAQSYMEVMPDEFLLPANGFIAKYVKSEKLRSVIAYMNPLYGGRGNETPAYIHAIINVLYIKGAARFVDGSSRFADILASVITDNGGEIHKGDAVEWIEVSNREVEYVRTHKGKTYTADYYISGIHPCALLKVMPEKAFTKAYRERLDSIPNSYSAFSLYIKLKEKSFPYINHSVYYTTKYNEVWNFGNPEKPWPLGWLFMTPPESEDSGFSRKVLVTVPMTFDKVEKWKDTTVGHRGSDYEEWKRRHADLLLKQIESVFPGFTDKIEAMNISSPLTIRDFYGSKDGCISGFSKNYHDITLSQVQVVTKVRNLLLTGQNVNLHGFCGVPLTAIKTCEAILGNNYIINKINSL